MCRAEAERLATRGGGKDAVEKYGRSGHYKRLRDPILTRSQRGYLICFTNSVLQTFGETLSSESFYGVGSHSDSFLPKLPERNLRVGK